MAGTIRKAMLALLSTVCVAVAVFALFIVSGCSPEAETYTLTFVYNDGNTEDYKITAEAGASVTAPEDPERSGYVFDGWYLTEDGTGDKQTIPSTMPEENVTYYAKWTEDGVTPPPAQYTITFVLNNGENNVTVTGAAGATLNVPQPERSGYIFDGWYLTEDGTGDKQTVPSTIPAENRTYYAGWTEIPQLSVSFDSVWRGTWVTGSGDHTIVIGTNTMSVDGEYLQTIQESTNTDLPGYVITYGGKTWVLEWGNSHYGEGFLLDMHSGTDHLYYKAEDATLSIESKYRGLWYAPDGSTMNISETEITIGSEKASLVVDAGYFPTSQDGYSAPIDAHVYLLVTSEGVKMLSWVPDENVPQLGDAIYSAEPPVFDIPSYWDGTYNQLGVQDGLTIRVEDGKFYVNDVEFELYNDSDATKFDYSDGKTYGVMYREDEYTLALVEIEYDSDTDLPIGYTYTYFIKAGYPGATIYDALFGKTFTAAGKDNIVISTTGEVTLGTETVTFIDKIEDTLATVYSYHVVIGTEVYQLSYDTETEILTLEGDNSNFVNVEYMSGIPSAYRHVWIQQGGTGSVGTIDLSDGTLTFDGEPYEFEFDATEKKFTFTVEETQYYFSLYEGYEEYLLELFTFGYDETTFMDGVIHNSYYLKQGAVSTITAGANVVGNWVATTEGDPIDIGADGTITIGSTVGFILGHDTLSTDKYTVLAGNEVYVLRYDSAEDVIYVSNLSGTMPETEYNKNGVQRTPVKLTDINYRGSWTSDDDQHVLVVSEEGDVTIDEVAVNVYNDSGYYTLIWNRIEYTISVDGDVLTLSNAGSDTITFNKDVPLPDTDLKDQLNGNMFGEWQGEDALEGATISIGRYYISYDDGVGVVIDVTSDDVTVNNDKEFVITVADYDDDISEYEITITYNEDTGKLTVATNVKYVNGDDDLTSSGSYAKDLGDLFAPTYGGGSYDGTYNEVGGSRVIVVEDGRVSLDGVKLVITYNEDTYGFNADYLGTNYPISGNTANVIQFGDGVYFVKADVSGAVPAELYNTVWNVSNGEQLNISDDGTITWAEHTVSVVNWDENGVVLIIDDKLFSGYAEEYTIEVYGGDDSYTFSLVADIPDSFIGEWESLDGTTTLNITKDDDVITIEFNGANVEYTFAAGAVTIDGYTISAGYTPNYLSLMDAVLFEETKLFKQPLDAVTIPTQLIGEYTDADNDAHISVTAEGITWDGYTVTVYGASATEDPVMGGYIITLYMLVEDHDNKYDPSVVVMLNDDGETYTISFGLYDEDYTGTDYTFVSDDIITIPEGFVGEWKGGNYSLTVADNGAMEYSNGTADFTATLADVTITSDTQITVNFKNTESDSTQSITFTLSGLKITFSSFGTQTLYKHVAATVTLGTIDSENGTAELSPAEGDNYFVGDSVTLTVSPAAGKKVDTVTVNSVPVSGSHNVYTFTIEATEVTVEVTFTDEAPVQSIPAGFIADDWTSADGDTFVITASSIVLTYSEMEYPADMSTLQVVNDKEIKVTLEDFGEPYYECTLTLSSDGSTLTLENDDFGTITFTKTGGGETSSTYSVTDNTSAADKNRGTVTVSSPASGDKFASGEQVTITVAPKAGYRLKQLKVNGSPVDVQTNEYKFNISEESTVEAFFEITLAAVLDGKWNAQSGSYSGNYVEIDFSDDSIEVYDSISGNFSGNFYNAEQITISNENSFVFSFTADSDPVVVTFTLKEDGWLYAEEDGYLFDGMICEKEGAQYSVSIEYGEGYSSEQGTASVTGGPFAKGTKVDITINAGEGYEVESVEVNNEPIQARLGNYSFEIEKNSTVKVTFRETKITLSSELFSDDWHGNDVWTATTVATIQAEQITFKSPTIQIDWTVPMDEVVIISETSFSLTGYCGDWSDDITVTFTYDSESGLLNYSSTEFSTCQGSLTKVVEAKTFSVTDNTTAQNKANGSVEISQPANGEKYVENEQVTITVTPNSGYYTASVTVNSQKISVSEDGTYKFNIEEDSSVVVRFELFSEYIADYVGTYGDGSTYTLVITEEGLTFTEDGFANTINAEISCDDITVLENSAQGFPVFRAKVTRVRTSGSVPTEYTATFTYSETTADQVTTKTFTVTLDGVTAFNCKINKITYTVTTNKTGNGTITISPEQEEYNPGDEITVTLSPAEGGSVKSLTVNGDDVTTSLQENVYKFNINANAQISVVFAGAGGEVEALDLSELYDTEWRGSDDWGTYVLTITSETITFSYDESDLGFDCSAATFGTPTSENTFTVTFDNDGADLVVTFTVDDVQNQISFTDGSIYEGTLTRYEEPSNADVLAPYAGTYFSGSGQYTYYVLEISEGGANVEFYEFNGQYTTIFKTAADGENITVEETTFTLSDLTCHYEYFSTVKDDNVTLIFTLGDSISVRKSSGTRTSFSSRTLAKLTDEQIATVTDETDAANKANGKVELFAGKVKKAEGYTTVNMMVIVTPNEGYRVKSVKYSIDGVEKDASKNSSYGNYYFNATGNATVKVEFEVIPEYTVTIVGAEETKGTVSFKTEAKEGNKFLDGTQVVMSISPMSGYMVTEVKVKMGGGTEQTLSADGNGDFKFTITADATVTVTFGISLDYIALFAGTYHYGNGATAAYPQNYTLVIGADGSIKFYEIKEAYLQTDTITVETNVSDPNVVLSSDQIVLKNVTRYTHKTSEDTEAVMDITIRLNVSSKSVSSWSTSTGSFSAYSGVVKGTESNMFTVTLDAYESDKGTVEVSKPNYIPYYFSNNKVYITVNPTEGYEVESVTYTINGSEKSATLETSSGRYYFTVSGNATVKVTFKDAAV